MNMDLPQINSRIEEGDIEKATVLYVFRPEQNYTCMHCVFVDMDKRRCKLYGAAEPISTDIGGCNMFIHGHEDKAQPYIGNMTKLETGYTENSKGFTCGRCEEWNMVNQSCKKVDKDSKGDTPGIIHQDACCNRWEMDNTRGKMTDEELTKFIGTKTK